MDTDDTTRKHTKPSEPAELDWLKPNIALTLACLIVLGAGLAILQVDASIKESNTARETTRVAVRAMRANVVAATVAGLEPQVEAERDFLPFRRPFSTSLQDAAGLSPATASAAIPELGIDALRPRLALDAERLTLKQRALAETRVTWNDRSTQYTTVIAVLAVALFLVGFGLVVEGPIRPPAYALGLGVALFAVGWATWIYFLPIPSTPDPAIEGTARGTALTERARYTAAIAAFDTALDADDEYAPAYVGRSRARLLAANPDYPTARAITIVSGPAIDPAVEDARRAVVLGDRVLVAPGLLALTSFYAGDYEDALAAVDDAIELNAKVPDLWLLRSAAQLALGDTERATASLERALALLRGTVPSQQTRLLASTYLSYMAWIERHVPAAAPDARRLGDRLVAVETRFTLDRSTLPSRPPANGAVTVQRLRFEDGELELELVWRDLPKGTALSVLGYERQRRGGAWSQPAPLALFADVSGSGRRAISVPLERACTPVEVRADVYLDGARSGTQTGPGASTGSC
jgi:tetratricopeptide (TPR) repeat protein